MRKMKQAVCLLLCFVMVVGLLPMTAFAADGYTSETATGSLPGGNVYQLYSGNITTGDYLIATVNNGTGVAMRAQSNSSNAATANVTVSNGVATLSNASQEAASVWHISVGNNNTTAQNVSTSRYIYMGGSSSGFLNTSTQNLVFTQSGSGYTIQRGSQNYYVNYNNNNNSFTRGSATTLYLYKQTTLTGDTVSFQVTADTVSLKSGSNVTLVPNITLDNGTLESYDIDWTVSNVTAYITVNDNGVVTASGDGSATVTATLNSVNGTALTQAISVQIPVTVQSKQLDTGFTPVLTGNDPITIRQGGTPDFSGIQLEVKYEGDVNTTIITVANGLVIGEYDNTTIGTYYPSISFGGTEYGTVRLTVEGDPYAGKENAADYPVYPEDGAVRIDKNAYEEDFQNTGVVRVELDVAGVSVKSAVDVILVTDLSNSMAWKAGGNTNATTHEDTKLYDLQQSVASFADIFLAADADGSATKNTMSLVTFGGFDKEYTNSGYDGTYADVTQTLLLGSSSADTVKTYINNIRLLLDDYLGKTYDGGYGLSFDGGRTYSGNYGNTNYDYAFMETSAAITALKAAYLQENGTSYDQSGRQIYILFMTDGAPSNYDGVYYRYQTDTKRPDVNATWINAQGNKMNYTMGNNRNDYSNAAWFEYIAGGTYNATTDSIPGNSLYWADQVSSTTGVANIYSVGFDLNYGGFNNYTFTTAAGRPLTKVLEKLVTGKTLEVYSADDQTGLSKIYSDLATKIRYAGTQAQVTDIVDSNFDLQLTQITGTAAASVKGDLGFKPTIEIKAYDLWTKEETSDTKLIGTRKGTSQTIETVTFSDDGTQAFSDKVDNGQTNIMTTASDGTVTIAAQYFTYTCTSASVETFKWNLGTITDKEVALSYYAYLTGTLEGTRPEAMYYTNQEAILEYLDINDKHATKVFPMPQVAWGGASTAYEFYLVNEAGQPCDRNGVEVPFANRIIITGPYYEELFLNQSENYYSKQIVAAKVLPAGYTLYDDTSYYEVHTASGDIQGYLDISEPASGKAQTTIVVSATTPSYIQSRVAFGVLYNEIPEAGSYALTPDKIVIDYGKSILVNVKANNTEVPAGFNMELVGFSMYYDNIDPKIQYTTVAYLETYDATYGDFEISSAADGIVKYTPTNFVDTVENIFCIFKITNAINASDTYYMVDALSVIPATSVYYETDFSTGVFATSTTATADADIWQQVYDSSNEVDEDNTQDDGTIGVNQTYGYDSTYTDDTHLSDGDSWFVKGQGYDTDKTAKTYVLFNFEGTGFDLISRTGTDQGQIKVEVFSDAGMTKSEKTVSVLNKSESSLELYQIPVVSINDLAYGTHYVRVSVDQAYNNNTTIPALDALNRGNEFYFDAIRVFDPAQGNAVAEEAYLADGESDRQLDEVRALLLDKDTYATITGTTTGMLFIDRTQKDVEIGTYASIGPNNETYLSKGQAVAFKVSVTNIPASFDIGAKSITGASAQMEVTVTSDTNLTTSFEFTKPIASSTAQNYNLLENATNAAAVFNNNEAYVVIENTGTGVLSITDIKVAYGNGVSTASDDGIMTTSLDEDGTAAYDPYAVSYTVDAATFSMARMVLTASETPEDEIPEETEPEVTEPETTEPEATEPETTEPEATEPEVTEPEATEPVYDIIKVSADTKGSLFNRKTYFTVVTTQDVASLKVAQMYWFVNYSSMTYEDLDNGTRVWTVAMPGIAIGSYTFTAYGADGTRGDSASVMSWGL